MSMSVNQIMQRHPPGTSLNHGRAMHEFMQNGNNFQTAHNRAVQAGFPPMGLTKNEASVLDNISGQLMKASKMHKEQAQRIKNLGSTNQPGITQMAGYGFDFLRVAGGLIGLALIVKVVRG